MANPRLVAVKALMSVNIDEGYSNIVLDKAVKSAELTGADAALATALFYGVLDRKLTLDYIIKTASARSGKTPDFVREVLRISVYQLVYMDKIPTHAAVNEAVKLIKKSKFGFASGFVNAVLRSVIREAPVLPDDDSVASLCVRYSCNEWIIERLIADWGLDTAKRILKSALCSPETYLRVNPLKTDSCELAEKLGLDITKASRGALTLVANGDVMKTSAYRDGFFHVQDLACQQCCDGLKAEGSMRVLDCCSAPGGKAFTIAENMLDGGKVVACDIHPHRVKLIKSGALRLGLKSVKAIENDATVYNPDLGEFDRVLCDVPCSGLGVIRRKPDIKYKSADGNDALPDLQYKILEVNARYLKSGGVLMYSTCTLQKSENDAVIGRFLKEHTDFEPYPFENGQYTRTLMPYDGTDGFFYARVKRK